MVEHYAGGTLDRARYEQAWKELVAGFASPVPEYLTYHKQRFYELFDHLALYMDGNPSPRVLELGMSPFSKLYKKLFPELYLVTADRPVELYGFDRAFACGECGSEHHYSIDLNRESISPVYGEPPLGTFDYVIFTEVLEHLIISPTQLFGELLALLKPTGLLYLTTPNFFAYYRLKQLAAGENPQGIFPKRGEDRDASFHFREYSMLELIDFFTQAGGEIVKAYFSDCWDEPTSHANLDSVPQYRAELMVVACQQGAAISRPAVSPSADLAYWRQYAKLPEFAVTEANPLAPVEVLRLRRLVQGYENGRLMRLMKWLHRRGLPNF